MSDENETSAVDLVGLTADIVSAYVSKNPIPVDGLPNLIASVHSSLAGVGQPSAPERPKQEPAVNPKRSVFPDYIICLEDGKKFKSLKRHLAVHYGLTPDEYREKWGLLGGLSYGGAELRGFAVCVCKVDWVRPEGCS